MGVHFAYPGSHLLFRILHLLILLIGMKVNVRVRGEWLLIPCKAKSSTELTVRWLGKEAFNRYKTMRGYNGSIEDVKEVRKARGGSLLYPGDDIIDVLDDNDFIHLSK